MHIVGITGPSGSGKSLLGKYLSSISLPVINADEVYHSLLIPPSECLDKLHTAFGNDIFANDGSLDRKKLSALVFNDKAKLDLLNSTVLDVVLKETRQIIKQYEDSGASVVFVDAPTLIESGFHKECNTVISVIAPQEIRTQRIIERDNLTKAKAEERIFAQKSDDFYYAHSDFVIINDTTAESFLSKAQTVLKGIIDL